MELVFTGVEVLSADEQGYGYRIGDGYVGVVIEARDDGGSLLGTITPECSALILPPAWCPPDRRSIG